MTQYDEYKPKENSLIVLGLSNDVKIMYTFPLGVIFDDYYDLKQYIVLKLKLSGHDYGFYDTCPGSENSIHFTKYGHIKSLPEEGDCIFRIGDDRYRVKWHFLPVSTGNWINKL